ncbi:MAG: hypothetical protein IKN27_04905 [Selenomonadaceae bacterium]|nr:hypothetical protein [Selenomonadaceae bacterium]
MNENLTVIFDCSGSFDENGKIEILRSLRLSTARIAENFGARPTFFTWREEIFPQTSSKDIVARGSVDVSALMNFIDTCPEGSKILLFSDGVWDLDACAKIKSSLIARHVTSVFVAVGADANRSVNYNISTFGGIWSPTDLPAAIQMLLFGGDEA